MTPGKRGAGQTALVTGASMGIGVDLAECFAQDGYDLVLAARSELELKNVAARVAAKFGVTAIAIAADLGRPGAGQALAGEIASRGLGVDVVVNNAGYGIAGAFNGSDEAAQLGMIDLNVAGSCRAHPYLVARNARERPWRRAQRGLDRRVPARTTDGCLLRKQVLRAVVLGSLVEGGRRNRRACELPLPGTDGQPVSRAGGHGHGRSLHEWERP